ncbi:MAG: type VI secretion system amidase effector protein Tae4 [Candidatus Symbiothrix sp.]|jgi:hypothetical protein|nr:type VI secretion system amidase effector protein Tae4 [Candidatus Symbiothrix sp.]
MAITYAALSAAFANIKDASPENVGKIIGGKVEWNIKNTPSYRDACAIRFSYALNKAGVLISSNDSTVSSGADGKLYLYKVNDVEKLVKNRIITTKILSGVISSDFVGEHGIIVFRDCDWNGAHIDLFDGSKVESKDYSDRCGRVTLYVLT